MDFISNRSVQIEEMLKELGISGTDALFQVIPAHLKLPRPDQEDGLSEYEGLKMMEKLASQNTYPSFENYLGAGAYEHHIPALVGAVTSKSEFLTSYTPYQAEASQGMLQIIFEFQSSICALTGLDAANASVYDGAAACAEAVLMALRQQKTRPKILIAASLHPHYRGVIDQYLRNLQVDVETIPFNEDGTLNTEVLQEKLDETVSAILIQSPNFFGIIEEVLPVSRFAKQTGVLTIQCANPLSYGLVKSAAEVEADIAVGDCQPFGISLQFGGPYAGYMACRHNLIRQMPGRIVGETVDMQGERGFVLTLQAREQHIRREKATSNICTNQALAALASLVAMLWYGKEGIQKLALTNYQRANYLKQQLENAGFTSLGSAPIFNEFVIRFDQPIEEVQRKFRQHGIEPGLNLSPYFPALSQHLLVAVTETKNKQQLDRYVKVAKEIANG